MVAARYSPETQRTTYFELLETSPHLQEAYEILIRTNDGDDLPFHCLKLVDKASKGVLGPLELKAFNEILDEVRRKYGALIPLLDDDIEK